MRKFMVTSYLARYVWLNAVGIQDYRSFPERIIQNAAPAFHFAGGSTAAARALDTAGYRLPATSNNERLTHFLQRTGTTAFLVIQHDTVLMQEYLNGFQRDSIVTSFSVAKSFVSALVGIALCDGLIRSLHDPLTEYLPDLRGDFWHAITIEHLVSMQSGLAYHEHEFMPWSDEPRVYYSPDLRQLARHVHKASAPGTDFHYNNYNLLLLGMILERVTGQTVSGYLEEKLWKPLGMEFSASWSLDSAASGMEKMESGLNARAIDYAKFARLYLHGGDWNGTQLIAPDWVSRSTQANENVPEHNYGYLWWVIPGSAGHYMAVGNLGQFIFVAPRQDMIVLRFGNPGVKNWQHVFPALFQQIVRHCEQADFTGLDPMAEQSDHTARDILATAP